MKQDLAFVANYYKSTIIPNTPDNFIIAEPFSHGLTNDELLQGLSAFREFMRTLYDVLAANKDKVDVKTGSKYDVHGVWNKNGDTKKCFPMLYSLGMTLIHLGLQGKLETTPIKQLTVHGNDLLEAVSPKCERYYSFIKMNPERKAEAFRLLNEAGLRFEGLDTTKGLDFTEIDIFNVTHNDDYVILGLKLYAQAQANIKQDYFGLSGAFMRCDFYSLTNITPKKQIMNIHEVVNSQSIEVKEWIKELDAFLTQNGCKLDDGCSEFTYIKSDRKGKLRKKTVCRIHMGIGGCSITPGYNHLENPDNIGKILPENLVNMILDEQGCHGCGGPVPNYKHCRHGGPYKFIHNGEEHIKCQWAKYQIDLYDADNRNFVRQWIERELTV